jgi:hypothetical protein
MSNFLQLGGKEGEKDEKAAKKQFQPANGV